MTAKKVFVNGVFDAEDGRVDITFLSQSICSSNGLVLHPDCPHGHCHEYSIVELEVQTDGCDAHLAEDDFWGYEIGVYFFEDIKWEFVHDAHHRGWLNILVQVKCAQDIFVLSGENAT